MRNPTTLGNLPPARKVDVVRDHWRRGLPSGVAARALSSGDRPSGSIYSLVRSVYAEPNMYDTYIDPVAIERALHGDRGAYEAMTYYELAALTDLIVEMANNGDTNCRWPGRKPMEAGGRPTEKDPGWVYLLAEVLGMEPHRFRKIKDKRASQGRKAENNGHASS